LEKGSTRKHTGKRVTRWRKMFGGIWGGFTLFYEGNLIGGILLWAFLRFCSVVHVGMVRRGDYLCYSECVWGINWVVLLGVPCCAWVDLKTTG
jgi:hypothetical protein